MSKTHWRTLYNPDYLGAYSLVDNSTGKYADAIKTIASVKVENVTGTDGKKEDCMVMRFVERDTKPMIVNATNAKMMEKLFKTPIIEEWAGRKIQIGVEAVRAFGDTVDALRIRKFLPKETGPVNCSDCNKEITGTDKMTAVQITAGTKKRYGKPMCAECWMKQIESEKTAPEEVPAQEGINEDNK